MTAAGAPPEMVDAMGTAATEGINNAIESGASPAEAFDMAGESVDAAMGDMGPGPADPGGEFGPPPGDMGPGGPDGPPPGGPDGPPPGDMGPGW